MEATSANFANNKDAFLSRFAKLFLPGNASGKISLVFKRGDLTSKPHWNNQAEQEKEDCTFELIGKREDRRIF